VAAFSRAPRRYRPALPPPLRWSGSAGSAGCYPPAAAVAPPPLLKTEAMRSAPGLQAIARAPSLVAGFSRRAGSREPAPETSTRLATSSCSRPNGTAHTGTPVAIAFCVAPGVGRNLEAVEILAGQRRHQPGVLERARP
jgi:hypothetical protein